MKERILLIQTNNATNFDTPMSRIPLHFREAHPVRAVGQDVLLDSNMHLCYNYRKRR